jgi:hypothetical protein
VSDAVIGFLKSPHRCPDFKAGYCHQRSLHLRRLVPLAAMMPSASLYVALLLHPFSVHVATSFAHLVCVATELPATFHHPRLVLLLYPLTVRPKARVVQVDPMSPSKHTSRSIVHFATARLVRTTFERHETGKLVITNFVVYSLQKFVISASLFVYSIRHGHMLLVISHDLHSAAPYFLRPARALDFRARFSGVLIYWWCPIALWRLSPRFVSCQTL